MAATYPQQPSPRAGMLGHHGANPGHLQPNGHAQLPPQPKNSSQRLTEVNEATWLQIGALEELMGQSDSAIHSYEHALRHNAWSVPAMTAISSILRSKDQFPAAVDYLRQILKVENNNGEVWGSLGHCYLMMDELQQAYSAYQQALYHLVDPKEPKLWYGIGILYDRYGSLEHAEEAFSQVMQMEPHFEKANEIYFRLGIIYKQQQKFRESLECFKYIVTDPPRPLTEEDIWFQIGHVHEQQKDYNSAKAAYKRVLERDPKHAKVLQQLGWLHHQQSTAYESQEQAIEYLEQSVNSDQTDAQSWYLLGRCYMSQHKYPKAYEAYQQAVYRDGRNPTFWCSIGVLYYQINQYRDALDAYSRAIRLNPNISEVWYDLGTLYESCNNQTADALDAYQRAAELDPTNVHIKARLQLLQSGQPSAGLPNQNSQPLPQDVHPQMYQPNGINGPPGPQWPGAPPPAQPPQGPLPAALGGRANDWSQHRLAEIQQPQIPQQQINHPYDQRDVQRPPVTQMPPRPASPRREPPRPYQEPPRQEPTGRRGFTPSPKTHHAAPILYQGPQGMQQPPPPQAQLPQHQQPPQNRITNPNYGPHSASVPPPSSGLGGPPPGSMPPYGRMTSPPPEVRPIVENQVQSPGSAYPRQQYQHLPNQSGPGGIANGAPPPASALAAAEAAARERESTRTPAIPKRAWEDDNMGQKPTDEKRPRLEDHHHRRPSPPPGPERIATPARRSPHGTEPRRLDEPPRLNDGYHPSEAAHHPPSLPSIHHTQSQQPQNRQISEAPKEERREPHEPAVRKMDVDEDYDDDGEDEKRNGMIRSGRNSPRGSANGMHHGASSVDQKA
ncbi:glucose repression mediator protein [Coniosporium apollinis]|uniref:Glucose repression mediator protein n=1 Tax=Coniosporium apollinis TaxID=61459 RepID=A0ABQ9NWA9_9PEZI|nr:glucose repression mediator protein [Coniosporium apollinis]